MLQRKKSLKKKWLHLRETGSFKTKLPKKNSKNVGKMDWNDWKTRNSHENHKRKLKCWRIIYNKFKCFINMPNLNGRQAR